MSAIGSIKRKDLIVCLRALGFEPPVAGRLRIPNPHAEDIGRGLLVRSLQQAGIGRDEWEAL
jgi:hypothetical protein